MSVRFLTEYMHAQLRAMLEHKWYLSEKAGKDVGLGVAAMDFISNGHAAKFQQDYFRDHNITATESDLAAATNGDSCLVIEFKATAHNHDTGEEALLEDKVTKYCLGIRPSCPHQREVSPGVYFCRRESK